MKKRHNECLFCTSRKCCFHIYSKDDCGETYNEIACIRHSRKLEEDADEKAPGIMKVHCETTGTQDRRRLDYVCYSAQEEHRRMLLG